MTPGALATASRVGNLVKHKALERVKRRRGAGRVSPSRFEEVLARHGAGHDEVFVHVGLSDVRQAFDRDPYEFLHDRLTDRFESVIAPGFTDYFAVSGVYHKTFSRPKHGTFGPLFLSDADYRTDDAMKSFLVEGPYRFDDCVHRDTYHENGCFAKLVEDDVLVVDVGTPWLTCSHLHYFESQVGVDYVTAETFEGVTYTDEERWERIEQTSGVRTSPLYSWNKPKITRLLERTDAVDRYDLNGLVVVCFTLGDLADALVPRLRADPDYLVTL